MDGLAAGKGDVAADYVDLAPAFASASKQNQEVRALPFYQAGLEVYGSGLVVGTDLIESKPHLVAKLIASIEEALLVTRADPESALTAMRFKLMGVDQDRALKGWSVGTQLIFGDGPPEATLGMMDEEGWARTIDHHASVHGMRTIPVEEAYDPLFVRPEVVSS